LAFAYFLLAFNVYALSVNIDGFLDDSEWQLAPTITKTYQVLPQTLNQQK
jgi:hypothetical protein